MYASDKNMSAPPCTPLKNKSASDEKKFWSHFLFCFYKIRQEVRFICVSMCINSIIYSENDRFLDEQQNIQITCMMYVSIDKSIIIDISVGQPKSWEPGLFRTPVKEIYKKGSQQPGTRPSNGTKSQEPVKKGTGSPTLRYNTTVCFFFKD